LLVFHGSLYNVPVYKIAVCDDDKETAAQLERYLSDIAAGLRLPCDIAVFHSAEHLRRAVQEGTRYDLIYLDIAFAEDEINGVQAGLFIRETCNDYAVSIVYISMAERTFRELNDTHPLYFLEKPLTCEQVEKTVKIFLKVAAQRAGGREVFTYKKGHAAHTVPVKDVVYFENLARKVIMHLSDGTQAVFYGSLKEAHEYSGHAFFVSGVSRWLHRAEHSSVAVYRCPARAARHDAHRSAV